MYIFLLTASLIKVLFFSQSYANEVMSTGQSIKTRPNIIIFSGNIKKFKTGEPRSLGGADFLTNSSGINYRITKFEYTLDNKSLSDGEMSETDIGITILEKNERVALNSGEEILMEHHYNNKKNNSTINDIKIPSGGFLLKNNFKLSVGSTSGVHINDGHGPILLTEDRLNNGNFLTVNYRITLVREDLILSQPVTSYRSPYRDRIYVANSGRITSPFTAFKNASKNNVKIHGLNVFLSNVTSFKLSQHTVDVIINGKLVKQINLPDHIPGKPSDKIPTLIPLNLSLKPNDTILVKGRVYTKHSIIFDFASFLIADYGLEPVNEQLNFLKADLNNDGFLDIIDLDAQGSLWVSIRVNQGLQETQQEWFKNLNKKSKFTIKDINNDGLPDLNIKNNRNCLNLTNFFKNFTFTPSYCSQTIKYNSNDIWADFNGDGWLDKLKVSTNPNAYLVLLGSRKGLLEETIWSQGFGKTDRMFTWDINEDSKADLITEWSDETGFRCLQWISTGKEFIAKLCK